MHSEQNLLAFTLFLRQFKGEIFLKNQKDCNKNRYFYGTPYALIKILTLGMGYASKQGTLLFSYCIFKLLRVDSPRVEGVTKDRQLTKQKNKKNFKKVEARGGYTILRVSQNSVVTAREPREETSCELLPLLMRQRTRSGTTQYFLIYIPDPFRPLAFKPCQGERCLSFKNSTLVQCIIFQNFIALRN